MAIKNIAGLTIIYHSKGRINIPDEPEYGPYKLVATLSGVDFLQVSTPSDEVIILRALTESALTIAIRRLNLREHSRLKALVITGPDGEIERIERRR